MIICFITTVQLLSLKRESLHCYLYRACRLSCGRGIWIDLLEYSRSKTHKDGFLSVIKPTNWEMSLKKINLPLIFFNSCKIRSIFTFNETRITKNSRQNNRSTQRTPVEAVCKTTAVVEPWKRRETVTYSRFAAGIPAVNREDSNLFYKNI